MCLRVSQMSIYIKGFADQCFAKLDLLALDTGLKARTTGLVRWNPAFLYGGFVEFGFSRTYIKKST